MGDNRLSIAYFRYFEREKQIQLSFALDFTHPRYGHFNREIWVFEDVNQDVGSLLQHVKNKIVNIVQKKWNEEIGKEDEDIDLNVNASLSRNTFEIASEEKCMELFQMKHKFRLHLLGKCYKINVNAPLLKKVKLPQGIYADCQVSPINFKGMYFAERKSTYIWSRSKDNVNWEEVYYERSYPVPESDIGYYLKFYCIPKNELGVSGPTIEITSENVVWEPFNIESYPLNSRHDFTNTKLERNCFRVVSYNVLAARYTEDNKFSYCDPKYLNIRYRKSMLMHELKSYNADIICFQEAEAATFNHYFRKKFKSCGYASYLHMKGNCLSEGLLLAFDTSRFKSILSEHFVVAHELKNNLVFKDLWSLLKRDEDLKTLFLKQYTSCHISALKLNGCNKIIVVINTHLYYHKDAGFVRLFQIAVILKYLSNFCGLLKRMGTKKEDICVIFCGDFNSQPDSPLFSYMTRGTIDNCEDFSRIGCEKLPKAFQHLFNFESAYGTPLYTNYTDDFKGCLDYIFFDKKNVKLINTVPLPDEEELAEEVALPSSKFPSDHVPLIADFQLRN